MANQETRESPKQPPGVDMIAMGVTTGVVATAIVQTGRGVIGTLSRSPLFMFGVGMIAGYYTHKYRKEIISVSRYSAEQSRDFLVRQKENLKEILAEKSEKTE